MRKLVVILVVALSVPSGAKVRITAYRFDGVTPLAVVDANQATVYRDIMVGTRLVILVQSDASGVYPDRQLWGGFLLISWDDSERGTLAGRDYNQQTFNYDGSILPAAGHLRNTKVQYRVRPSGVGFELKPDFSSVAGDWFVLDYHAERIGTCTILLNQFTNVILPTETLSFRHVASRDFNGDTVVDFRDFALFASHWGSVVRAAPNDPDAIFDLNRDAQVDFGDLALFSEYWLERTDWSRPAGDPNGLSTDSPL